MALTLQKQSGDDSNSRQGNAHFRNPAAGDYSVDENSQVLSLGFVNFPMDKFGVTSLKFKVLAKTPLLPAMELYGHDQTRCTTPCLWRGLYMRDISGLGDISAAGLSDERGVLILKDWDSMKEGDVILEMNGKPVRNLQELRTASNGHEDELSLSVWRFQSKHTIILKY